MLGRLCADDKAAKKELEEKEDMNRKGGKLASRIPTFHKRPSGVSQSAESPAQKKDASVHVAQPLDKTGTVEASKTKPHDARALPPPSVRVPRIGAEASSPFMGTENAAVTAAHGSERTTPKSWSLSVSPRPALRPEQGLEQHLPEQDERRSFEIEADTIPDAIISSLPHVDSISHKPPVDTEEENDVEIKSAVADTGDTEKSEPAEFSHTTELSKEEAIMDEEPPWETEQMNIHELKDSRSSSDIECEDDSAGEKPEVPKSEEHHENLTSQSESFSVTEEKTHVDDLSSPVAPEKPAEVSSTRSTEVSIQPA